MTVYLLIAQLDGSFKHKQSVSKKAGLWEPKIDVNRPICESSCSFPVGLTQSSFCRSLIWLIFFKFSGSSKSIVFSLLHAFYQAFFFCNVLTFSLPLFFFFCLKLEIFLKMQLKSHSRDPFILSFSVWASASRQLVWSAWGSGVLYWIPPCLHSSSPWNWIPETSSHGTCVISTHQTIGNKYKELHKCLLH